ncbi:CheW domain protein [Nitrincola lacisaponensis]|uniref:CheW domain protein n=1 Tax=Nitrincola lacisaponensis TaxID=267850 RepID=A0A063Y4Z9_9GAMM|nr:chemotaxis protein CheW [Nitrincola lacisaponensis]KDE39582.1 CheW domain protein [Nitrincola lacisaponensis]
MADQKKVVYEYLEALLHDPDAETSEAPLSERQERLEIPEDSVAEVLDSCNLAQHSEPEPEPVVVGSSEQVDSPVVRCILVDVHGLKLAIPISDVDGAQEISSLTMSIEMRHDWIIGHFGPDDTPVSVIDTGRWVIPQSYSVDKAAYTDVLILKGRRWALACNQIIQSVDLSLQDINLNQDKDRRAWLYGTSLKQRCAVLDTDQLLEEFEVMII